MFIVFMLMLETGEDNAGFKLGESHLDKDEAGTAACELAKE